MLFVTVQRIMELAPGMYQASGKGDLGIGPYFVVHGIAIALQIAMIIGKQFFGSVLSTAFAVIKKYELLNGIVIDPLISLVRTALFVGIQYLDRTLIGLDIIRGQYFLFQCIVERFQQLATTGHPVAHSALGRFPPKIPFEHLDLAEEREMIDIFANQDVRQQTGFGYRFVDGAGRERCDQHALSVRLGVLGPDRPSFDKACGWTCYI